MFSQLAAIQVCSVTERLLPVNFFAIKTKIGIRYVPMRLIFAIAVLVCSACADGLSGQYFRKGDLKYRVAKLDSSVWRPVRFADNDLAWTGPNGSVLAMNSTCRDYGDPPLDVLTQHMLMGFSERVLLERKTFVLDGRDAMESTYTAKLDGVPVELAVAVLKKDGCVYDFTFVAMQGQLGANRGAFEALIDGFTTTSDSPAGRTATVRVGVPEIRPEEQSSINEEGKGHE